MKTTVELHGYEIVIEETENGVSVSAIKDDEVVEEFELELNTESSGDDDDDFEDDFQEEPDFEDADLEDDELETRPQTQGQKNPQAQAQRMPQAQGQRMPQAQKSPQSDEEQTLESLTFDKFLKKQKVSKRNRY